MNITVFLILIFGFLLRILNLDGPSLRLDELITFCRGHSGLAHVFESVRHSPFPPLYYIIINLWIKAFGWSEWVLRFPSAVCSTLAIFFIYKLSSELFDKRAGVISALLLAVSTYSINYAQDAKNYAMIWLLSILMFLYFFRFARDGGIKHLVCYVLSAMLALYTSYIGFLFLAVHLALSFFLPRTKLIRWLCSLAVIFILYLPWLGVFIFNAAHKTGLIWIPRDYDYLNFLWFVFTSVTGINTGEITRISGVLRLAEFILYLAALFCAFFRIKDRGGKTFVLDAGREVIFLTAWIFIPIFIYLCIDMFYVSIHFVRYVGLIHIPLIILMARGISRYSPKARFSLLVTLITIIVIAHMRPYYSKGLKYDGQDWRKLTEKMGQSARGPFMVIACFGDNVDMDCIVRYYLRTPFSVKSENMSNLWRYKNELSGYESIFIVYCGKPPSWFSIDGFRVEKNDFYGGGGLKYVWLKRMDPLNVY